MSEFVLLIAIGFAIPSFIKSNVEDTAKSNAVELISTFHAIRDFYNKAVVSKALTLDNVEVTHRHAEVENGIPAPATFLLDMAGGSDSGNVTIQLTSPFPFVDREGRTFDEFQQDAWKALTEENIDTYAKLDQMDGKAIIRIAAADKMNHINCVNCHNNHPASMKHDWKLGDTRGIVEVQFDVTKQLSSGRVVSFIVVAVFAIAIGGLLFFAHMSARNITRPLGMVTSALHDLSEDRQDNEKISLKETNIVEINKLSVAFDRFQDHENERKRLVGDITRLAFFDTMTGLSNKARFINLLNHSLIQTDEVAETVPMVVLIEIDQYRTFNESMGHQSGDEMLRTVAKRLQALNPDEFHPARYTEETFAVLTLFRPGSEQAHRKTVIEILRNVIGEPVQINNQSIQLTASFGISFAPNHGITADRLVTAADVALSWVKNDHGDGFRVYSQDMAEDVQFRLTIANDLKVALGARRLIPYFQPQIDLTTGELIGAEALIRWPTDEGGFIAPGVFIPIAEQTQLIIEIGHYMIEEVCCYAAMWKKQGLTVPRLAINISAIQFTREHVCDTLKNVLQKYDLRPEILEVEITESAMSGDIELAIERLRSIRNLGVEISLDDFGTGYSSLSYLQSLPLDRLKIDQSFVRDMMSSDQSRQIVKTIISLGRTMDLKVLAEGIESEAEGSMLQALGCNEGQGYHYARPMPPDAFFDFALNLQNTKPAMEMLKQA